MLDLSNTGRKALLLSSARVRWPVRSSSPSSLLVVLVLVLLLLVLVLSVVVMVVLLLLVLVLVLVVMCVMITRMFSCFEYLEGGRCSRLCPPIWKQRRVAVACRAESVRGQLVNVRPNVFRTQYVCTPIHIQHDILCDTNMSNMHGYYVIQI